MSQQAKVPRFQVIKVVMAMILCLVVGGCIGPHADHSLLHEAQKERTAASIRLAKAITRYCSVASTTVDARDACVVNQHLSSMPFDTPATTSQLK